MPKSDVITKEDKDLFRNSVGPVEKIEHDSAVFDKPKPPPISQQTQADNDHVLEEFVDPSFTNGETKTEDKLLFQRSGIQKRVMHKLQRGQFAIEMVLDLHGMTVKTAREALKQFLADCRTTNRRCIKIIHGKGYGSKDRLPVLKNKLNQWLQQRDEVMAYCSARPSDGGTGAVYVLIKRQT